MIVEPSRAAVKDRGFQRKKFMDESIVPGTDAYPPGWRSLMIDRS
ncbi:Uncharacterised protein [Paucimonas lemoignei]|jgi:hypothetical protein|nr:Uncharacterised protein [Paucimonas lemoignei]